MANRRREKVVEELEREIENRMTEKADKLNINIIS